MKGRVLLALRPSVRGYSHGFPYADVLPECPGIDPMPEAEKIKKRATTLPDIAVPAGATRTRRLVHPQGGVCVLAIAMMLSEGTAPQATLIQRDVATDDRIRVLS